jgi:hypothetical protein
MAGLAEQKNAATTSDGTMIFSMSLPSSLLTVSRDIRRLTDPRRSHVAERDAMTDPSPCIEGRLRMSAGIREFFQLGEEYSAVENGAKIPAGE